jgi:NAD(P)-dependent dehydrogenase (short-subunit alcohol dehydrogenase family)
VNHDFAGKVVLVSGGSRGIGRAAAQAFAHRGASVAIAGRTAANVTRTALELDEIACHACAGGGILGVTCDLMEAAGVEAFVERSVERFGGVDVLVNNVGASGYGPLLEVTDEMLVSAWRVKLLAAIRLTRAVVPIMETRGGGSIVNLSGGSGREPQSDGIVAGTTNAGVRAFTKAVAADLARRGIGINSICPGLVRTDRHLARARARAEATGTPVAAVLAEWDAQVPTGRVTDPDEVADLILFLAARRIPNLVGAEIVLDGGTSRAL